MALVHCTYFMDKTWKLSFSLMILATDSTTNLYESPFHLTLQRYLDNLTKSENPTKTVLKIKIRKNIVGALFDRSSFDFTFSLFKFLLILILELSVAWNFNDIFLAFMISRITIWNWLLISCQLTTALSPLRARTEKDILSELSGLAWVSWAELETQQKRLRIVYVLSAEPGLACSQQQG